jgi:hypothetical protein
MKQCQKNQIQYILIYNEFIIIISKNEKKQLKMNNVKKTVGNEP